MWPNPQVPADLVTFTEETLNGKVHSLCSASKYGNIENLWAALPSRFQWHTQLIFTCSKLTIETLEKGVKYVQS